MRVILATSIAVIIGLGAFLVFGQTAERPADVKTPARAQAKGPLKFELTLSPKQDSCVKPGPCRFTLDIYNPTDTDFKDGAIVGVYLWPRSKKVRAYDLFAGFDPNTMEKYKPGIYSDFQLAAGQRVQKELDLNALEWKVVIHSTDTNYPLWQQVVAGEYEISLEIGEDQFRSPRERVVDVEATKRLGLKDVTFERIIPKLTGYSGRLPIDFKTSADAGQ